MTTSQIDAIVDALRQAHWAWREEVDRVFAPTRELDAGPWERSTASRYLKESFAPRLNRESDVIAALAERPSEEGAAHLWALRELLHLLCRRLCELVPSARSGPAFVQAANTLVRAFGLWCADGEAMVEAVAVAGGALDIADELAPFVESGPTAVSA